MLNKILMVFIMVLLVVPLAIAFEFDNSKNYDESKKEYTITNLFGFGEDIAKLKLDTPLNNFVARGDEVLVAEFTITSYEDYNEILSAMEFKDIKNHMNTITREFNYKYKTLVNVEVPDIKETCDVDGQSCTYERTGSHIEKRIEWRDFSKNSILKDEVITIGIFTEVKAGDKIEWIPTVYGNQKLEKWASWTESMNLGLLAYYDFNEGDGTDVGDLTGNGNNGTWSASANWSSNGILGNASQFDGVNFINLTSANFSSLDYSFSFWINRTKTLGANTRIIRPVDHATYIISVDAQQNGIGIEGTASASGEPTLNRWEHYVITANTTFATVYKNGILNRSGTISKTQPTNGWWIIGNPVGYKGLMDEFGVWNRTLSGSEISDLYNNGNSIVYKASGFVPSVTLNIPTNNTNSTLRAVLFNCTSTNDVGILNLTLVIDGINNETVTNSTAEQNLSIQTTKTLSYGKHNWTCKSFDRNLELGNIDNRTLNINKTIFGTETFNSETFEGTVENFEININISEPLLLSSAKFIYNGTSNIASINNLGSGKYNLTKELTIPGVSTNRNVSFYWSITLSDDSVFNSTTNNQTIRNLGIDNCSTSTITILNFTVRDEKTQIKLDGSLFNVTVEISVDIFPVGSTTATINFSGITNNTNPVAVCLNKTLDLSVYRMDTAVRYESLDRASEFYHIQNFDLTNDSIPQNINLYDLLTADSTEFQVTFTGSDFLAVEDALIFIKRQYISENLFKTVELPKTDSNGQTTVHLVRNEVIYNIEVIKNGILLGSFNNIIAFCEDFTIGDCKINLNAFSTGEEAYDYNESLGITFTGPNFNNDTRIMSFNYVTIDGSVKNITMEVSRNDIFGNRSLCNSTIQSAGGTLSCTIPGIDDTLVITKIFIDGQEEIKDYTFLQSFNYGKQGYFILFVFVLSFVLMLGKSKTGILFGILLGFISGIALGLVEGKMIGGGASGVWLVIIVILMLWKLNRRRKD